MYGFFVCIILQSGDKIRLISVPIGRVRRYFQKRRLEEGQKMKSTSKLLAALLSAAVVLPSFITILLMMALLKKLLKNPYVQAVLRGLKPCIIGIILATGIFMILQHCFGSIGEVSVNATAVLMTAALAAIYFGSRKIMKKGLSPIGLIGIAAAAGIIVYGM